MPCCMCGIKCRIPWKRQEWSSNNHKERSLFFLYKYYIHVCVYFCIFKEVLKNVISRTVLLYIFFISSPRRYCENDRLQVTVCTCIHHGTYRTYLYILNPSNVPMVFMMYVTCICIQYTYMYVCMILHTGPSIQYTNCGRRYKTHSLRFVFAIASVKDSVVATSSSFTIPYFARNVASFPSSTSSSLLS